MFAVVRTGGKQYRVAAGDKIAVEKLAGEAGETITLGDVLLAGDGEQLADAAKTVVSAEIIAQAKSEKVLVFKKRRRHNYRRKNGHRQLMTLLRIVAVGESKVEKKPAPKADPAPSAPEMETDTAVAKPVKRKVAAVKDSSQEPAAPTTHKAEPVKKAATRKATAAKPTAAKTKDN